MNSWRSFWKSVTNFEWTHGVNSGRVSIILNGLKAFILEGCHSFCTGLQAFISGRVSLILYWTPGENSGRASHILKGLMAFILEGRHSFCMDSWRSSWRSVTHFELYSLRSFVKGVTHFEWIHGAHFGRASLILNNSWRSF